jgi:hypothetical protein
MKNQGLFKVGGKVLVRRCMCSDCRLEDDKSNCGYIDDERGCIANLIDMKYSISDVFRRDGDLYVCTRRATFRFDEVMSLDACVGVVKAVKRLAPFLSFEKDFERILKRYSPRKSRTKRKKLCRKSR